MDPIEILWREYSSLIEQEIDALNNRDVLQLVELTKCKEILFSLLAFLEGLTDSPSMPYLLKVFGKIGTAALEEESPPLSAAEPKEPHIPLSVQPEERLPVLGPSRLRILRLVLTNRGRSMRSIAKEIWPDEPNKNRLSVRIADEKRRSLPILKTTLGSSDISNLGLPAEEEEFYRRLQTELGTENTYEQVKKILYPSRVEPKAPTPIRTPRKGKRQLSRQRKRIWKGLTLGSQLRVIEAVLSQPDKSWSQIARNLWPEEPRSKIDSRISYTVASALKKVERALTLFEEDEGYARKGLPANEIAFYERLREQFGKEEAFEGLQETVRPRRGRKRAQAPAQGQRGLTETAGAEVISEALPEYAKALQASLSGRHQTVMEAVRGLYPEADLSGSKKRNTAANRFRSNLVQGLIFLRRNWDAQQDRLSETQRLLLHELKKRFGSVDEVTVAVEAFKRVGRNVGTTATAVSPTPNAQLTQAVQPLNGFMNKDQARIIQAALLDEKPTLNMSLLISRTGFTIGGLPPILNGALRQLEQIIQATSQGLSLTLEADRIIGALRQRWLRRSLGEILKEVRQGEGDVTINFVPSPNSRLQ
jgi:hypothetical protein